MVTGKVIPLHPGTPKPIGAPWYKQFWPWFLIALPASSVVASIITLVIAVRNADSLVRPNYYDAGVHINKELALDRAAVDRGITAALRIDPSGPGVVVNLTGAEAAMLDALILDLGHPTHPERNRSFQLTRTGAGEFRAPLDGPLRGAWYARLVPPSGAWRLQSRIDFDGIGPLPIGPTS